MKLKEGQQAPDFELPDQDGSKHKLSDYRGKRVLLYFYPQDDTSGCTKEACGVRDTFPQFGEQDAIVLGLSVDSVDSHRKFADKYDLPHTLLSDESKRVVQLYDVWGQKSDGTIGTLRTSFLIDPEGKIEKIYENVAPEHHAEEVLADLKK